MIVVIFLIFSVLYYGSVQTPLGILSFQIFTKIFIKYLFAKFKFSQPYISGSLFFSSSNCFVIHF